MLPEKAETDSDYVTSVRPKMPPFRNNFRTWITIIGSYYYTYM